MAGELIVHLPPDWKAHVVGDLQDTHLLRKVREGWLKRVGEINIQVAYLPGGEGGSMLGVTIDGNQFYLTERDGKYAGGGLIEDRPMALIARITEHGCMLEVCAAEAVV